MMNLGLVAESTDRPLRPAIAFASSSGCRAIQFDAVGEVAPDRLGGTARRELRILLAASRMESVVLHAPLRRGLDVTDDQQPRMEFVRKVMDLAIDLGSRQVLVPFPAIPEETHSSSNTLHESLDDLGRYADRTGCRLLLEGGIDPAATVIEYLANANAGAVGIAYDPVNYLVNGHDPLGSLTTLMSRLGSILARDGRAAKASGAVTEMPLGAGEIDWISLFATASAFEFSGPVLARRLMGTNRAADVAAGVQFLRRFVPLDNS
jgi:sugar phosphate isomerase/epimerase